MLKSRMRMGGLLGPILLLFFALFCSATPSRAAGCEDKIARHMVGEAMLAAQFVAAAEKNGMTTTGINGILKDIADKSAIQEFWITDASGHAYLTQWILPSAPMPKSSRKLRHSGRCLPAPRLW